MQTITKKWSASIVGIGLLCALLSGCATTLDKAKHTAAVSQQVYTSVQAETVKQIAAIVEKDNNGTIVQADRDRLGLLNELRKVLDKFADAHNAYVSSLKVWETSGKRSTELDEVSNQMLTLIQNAQDLAKRLNIKIR